MTSSETQTSRLFGQPGVIDEAAQVVATLPEEFQTLVTQRLQGQVTSVAERAITLRPAVQLAHDGGPLPDNERSQKRSFLDPLWTIHDVSVYLVVPVGTLYRWRHLGEGPPAIRLGRHLRYDPDSVHSWALSQAS